MDQSVFLRHGDIDDVDFKIRLDFLRDFKNKLGLLSQDDEIVFREQLERDSTRQVIAKLATRSFQAGGEQKLKTLINETYQSRYTNSETMQSAA